MANQGDCGLIRGNYIRSNVDYTRKWKNMRNVDILKLYDIAGW